MNDVYGIVFRETLPFPDFPSDMINVCNLGGSSKCPIKAGKSFTETAILPVTKLAPSNVSNCEAIQFLMITHTDSSYGQVGV